jgi:hypothetical protein
LGDSLANAHRESEAEDALEQALSEHRQHFGSEDVRTLKVSSALARVLALRGDDERAISLQRTVLETYARTLGDDDPATVKALWELAAWTHWAGEETQAKVLALSLVEKQRRLLGEQRSKTKAAESLLQASEDAGEGDT